MFLNLWPIKKINNKKKSNPYNYIWSGLNIRDHLYFLWLYTDFSCPSPSPKLWHVYVEARYLGLEWASSPKSAYTQWEDRVSQERQDTGMFAGLTTDSNLHSLLWTFLHTFDRTENFDNCSMLWLYFRIRFYGAYFQIFIFSSGSDFHTGWFWFPAKTGGSLHLPHISEGGEGHCSDREQIIHVCWKCSHWPGRGIGISRCARVYAANYLRSQGWIPLISEESILWILKC